MLASSSTKSTISLAGSISLAAVTSVAASVLMSLMVSCAERVQHENASRHRQRIGAECRLFAGGELVLGFAQEVLRGESG